MTRRPGFCEPLPLTSPPSFNPEIAKRLGTSGICIELQAGPSEGLVVAEDSKQAAGLVVAEDSKQATATKIQADDLDRMEMGGTFDENMWEKAALEFENDFHEMENKMHRFPATLRGLGSRYIVPKVVSIGPYHRGLDHLKEMQTVKQVAAYQYLSICRTTYEEIHDRILIVAGDARSLYPKDVVAAIGYADFLDMMILDGIFLLQYLIMTVKPRHLYSSLLRCFHSNQACISNDIMLLENQLPWVVIKALNEFHYYQLEMEVIIAKMGRTLQVREDKNSEPFGLNDDHIYTPPHLLGVLRQYKIGKMTTCPFVDRHPDYIRPMSNISVIELAELGIKLTASKTTKFMDMGIKRGPLFSKIFVAPLLLDETRSCWLVNMVAFEICIATDFRQDTTEKPVVCAYLAVLAMLMDREEDVHKLRSKQLVQGELTNMEMLNFFKSLIKHISGGPLFIQILEEIEYYRRQWWMLIKLHAFFYKNYKIIAAVLSVIGVLVGIFKTLLSLKKHGTTS